MKIIVGLGNPGTQYANTRHNAGFLALDKLAAHPAIAVNGEIPEFNLDKKLKSRKVYTLHKGEKIFLIKPDTFMNASGTAVSLVMKYYKADLADLTVISDDVDLPLGEARVRLDGGSAGQKGLQNIIDTLGTDAFKRVRIGINSTNLFETEHDTPNIPIDTADFVLQRFTDRELPLLDKILDLSVEFVLERLDSKSDFKPTSLRI